MLKIDFRGKGNRKKEGCGGAIVPRKYIPLIWYIYAYHVISFWDKQMYAKCSKGGKISKQSKLKSSGKRKWSIAKSSLQPYQSLDFSIFFAFANNLFFCSYAVLCTLSFSPLSFWEYYQLHSIMMLSFFLTHLFTLWFCNLIYSDHITKPL